MTFSKRDIVSMTPEQLDAGRRMWRRSAGVGRLAKSSFDAEAMAPKTWILWMNGPDLPDGRGKPIIQCELYPTGRASNSAEAVGMLIGQCPVCLGQYNLVNYFIAREDNKTMYVEYVPYRKAPPWVRDQWREYARTTLCRPPLDEDRIPLVSSPERWACDYKCGWVVRVTEGVASTDMTGVAVLRVPMRPHLLGQDQPPDKLEF